MNAREGTKRMRLLGMAMTAAPVIFWALYNLYQIQPSFSHSGFSGFEYHFSVRILAGAVVLAIPGAILWAAGWVVDGFFKEPK
jgi:hypothetical protein